MNKTASWMHTFLLLVLLLALLGFCCCCVWLPWERKLRGFVSMIFCCGEASRVAAEELDVSNSVGEVLIVE